MASKSKKIRIGFSIPNFDTAGSGKAMVKILSNLDKNIFEPHIICMHDRGVYFQEVEALDYPIHIMRYTCQMKPYFRGILKVLAISRKFKKLNLDLIHSFHYASDYSEPLAAKLAGVKWVFTKKNMNWGGTSKNSWLFRSFLANRILVQNTDMIKEFYPKSKKIDLVSRGVDLKEFKRSISQEIIANKRIVICVANLVPIKGVEYLIEAFKLCKPDSDWELWILGENENDYGVMLKKLVAKLKMENKVRFLGKRLNVVDYLNTSEIFVLPTLNKGRKEGSPVSILEAMSCELNVLGSNIPGIKDQLNQFPDALFKAGDVEDLYSKLFQLMNNSRSVNTMYGKQFRNMVEKKYSIEREVQEHENVYFKVLRRL